jgi:putative membrane protein
MILLRWLITTLAIFSLPYFVAGILIDAVGIGEKVIVALMVAAFLLFVALVVKPIVTLLTLPINIITLGLFSLVLNGVFFWFASQIINGFTVETFKAAIIGSLFVSIINWIVSRFVND